MVQKILADAEAVRIGAKNQLHRHEERGRGMSEGMDRMDEHPTGHRI
jgi:hypothetical protein